MKKAKLNLTWLLICALALAGCAQFQWAAQRVQGLTLHPVNVAAAGFATDTRCDDQPTTYSEARAAITVPIVETKITAGKQTALPWVLLVEKGFSKLPTDEQLVIMRHELVHYCQRRTIPGFDQLWLTGYIDEPSRMPRSDYRAAFEVAAYRVGSGRVPSTFVRVYLLYDLEPASLALLVEAVDPP